ncbi:multifunctional CCA addition/repair protein [Legionella hackeliae]|uniref:Multifunctional CCA protein n=1 Tax=Legionella hackeliae TaxID=449 RepID=A0A0A8USD0_LEGHA|nr:multifunctional CCA addition/repair protein [Legionella hackeliae]KTD09919.1 tRNA nucleotidyltransferase [Legionella hackeliae]CEK11780.1 Multifunctional CCA protein [Includes: CCA-adding enzyme; 2'-nucleotidase; 2',3'-cyclic phosphodiesterase; Phosphatase] [Legionella hackeliae]STX48551.1 tRNA nucleotidyltransferase [Legionella hackeliae]
MKVYLVGGAVRDQLLGYPVKERDWVVVGATPEQMLQLGYQQVGRDFPVFLHPQTKEEYALARMERKSAPGYYGFKCDFNPNVSLEDDLLRRDLTINAMAMDTNGHLIDPYNGETDLKEKLLRHVSPAFIEDPVRVLRVARFAARYHHLGFKLADETRALMYLMVKRGELNHLVAERVWQEWFRSFEEKNPEVFISTLRACGALKVILPELDVLFGIPGHKKYHPEVDSGMHTLMVLEKAVTLSADPMVRFAALVHDLGKGATPMNEWPRQVQHEIKGVEIIRNLCTRLRIPADYRKFAETVSRFHLNIHRFFELRPQTRIKVLEQTDAFRRPQLFEKLLLVCEADAKGRGSAKNEYKQAENWRHLLKECAKISAQTFIAQGYEGEAIKKALHQQRVACAEQLELKYEEQR